MSKTLRVAKRPPRVCDDCVNPVDARGIDRHLDGSGCTGCPIALMPERLRVLNARMFRAGLRDASFPVDAARRFADTREDS